jgi:hypothetical protein
MHLVRSLDIDQAHLFFKVEAGFIPLIGVGAVGLAFVVRRDDLLLGISPTGGSTGI